MRHFGSTLLLICAATLALVGLSMPTDASAQPMGAQTKVSFTASAGPKTAGPGEQVSVHVDLTIDEGWKMYAVDSPPPSRGVNLHIDDIPDGLSWSGEVLQDTPQRGYDPNFKKEVTYFQNRAHIWADLDVEPGASPGPRTVTGKVEYMICDKDMCYPPVREAFAVDVVVDEGSAPVADAGADAGDSGASAESAPDDAPATASDGGSGDDGEDAGDSEAQRGSDGGTAAPPTGNDGSDKSRPGNAAPESQESASAAPASALDELNDARSDGLLGFLLLAIGAGAAALLTPCVFPMIPLTVSFFTKHSESRSEAVRMASLYGFAIIATFTGLGVAMAMILGAAGAQSIAANPWVNLFIGSVFVIFALSLLGLFELRLPSGLVNYFNRRGNERQGVAGVLFMGLTLTLVSFSCTAPFVGGLLAATSGGEWFYPVVGMLAFSATFAVPFIGFAMFPRALESLPQSGQWMNAVKVTLGFVELAAALKFLSNADLIWGTQILSRTLAIALTIVIFSMAGLYLLGKLRLKHEAPTASIGSLRLLAATAFFGLALFMLPGLFGAPLGAVDAYLPPRQASDPNLFVSGDARSSEKGNSEFEWHTDEIEAAFTQAAEVDKPVFIDFTGYTCTNCRDMEANVFPQAPVAEQFRSDFVLLRLYTDAPPKGTEFQRYQLKLTGTTALPTYAIVDPQDRSLIEKDSGVSSVEDFADFLRQGRAEFQDQRLADAR
ncbi:cytochrome C biogenesis protein [Longibacter salinarum]|uniref:Cytochrome C biogenesis protein n=1 Tax=Longibacter salinarum TaxID=1850348 RepID=A0A2A8D1Q6_9BACT|nr:cytochrome c biogenesis protein CcdA [Longibacter salinarum]PEN14846.1 cytochrome C biogenesis protein [Longibacter salinarum]